MTAASDERMAAYLEEIADLAERTNQLYREDRLFLRKVAEYLRTDPRLRE